ncbi:MAG: hypothetical protein QOJ27_1921 [Sphingomonadales bacterium]|nr:hypothetical protein [Sphingomonadales bacterium]
MKRTIMLLLLLASGMAAVAAEPGPAGTYRLTGEQDAASGLRLRPDGHFQYFLIVGALDEQAEGRWSVADGVVTLTTEPTPVPPAFTRDPSGKTSSAALTVRVHWPEGHGVAGTDLRIGFDEGPPLVDYTQEDGWSLPPDQKRTPRWIELKVPMHDFTSPPFPIDLAAGNALAFTLTPNDLGIFDFQGVRIEAAEGALIVERNGARLRYQAVRE